MKRFLIFISFILVLAMLTVITPISHAKTEDESWKIYLADFLKNNYPSLFDEEIKKRMMK